MNDALPLLLATLAGAALGGLYLRLLWLASRRLPQQRGGVGMFLALALARAALVLAALAAAVQLGAPAAGLLAALAGFIVVRVLVTRLVARERTGGEGWR